MVMLRVVAGLDVQQVADLVGKNPGTVRVAVHRALRSLSRDPRVRSVRRVVSDERRPTTWPLGGP